MANEFIIRKGYKSLASSEVTGSLTLIGDYESIRALTINSTKGTGTEHYFRTHGVNGDNLSLYSGGNRVFRVDSNSVDVEGTFSATGTASVGDSLTVTSTAAATLILRGDSGNSGDAGELDSTIKMLHDDGTHGILIETRNFAGKQSFKVRSLAAGTESDRFTIHEDNYFIFTGDIRPDTDSSHNIGTNDLRYTNGYFDNLQVKTNIANNTAAYINYISNQGHRFYIDGNNDDTSHKFQILSNTSTYDANNVVVEIDQSGAATFDGDITANNLSGTNTGDQDLSGYLLNTSDTLTGTLSIANSAFTGLSLTRNSGNGSSIDFKNSNGLLGRTGFLSDGSFAITNGTAGTSNMLAITSGGNISATNLSGTNTGDQDLSGYLLNSTDTFTGNLNIFGGNNNSKESFINVKRGDASGEYLKFQTDSTTSNDVSQFVIRRNSDSVDLLSITTSNGNTAFAGNLTTSGDITLGANHIGRDADNYVGFETDDQIGFRVAGAAQVNLIDGALNPQTDSDIDLGTNTVRYKNIYADNIYGAAQDLAVSANDTFSGTYSLLWHDGADVYSSSWLTVAGATDTLNVPKIAVAGGTFTGDVVIGTFGTNNSELAFGTTIADKVFNYGAEFQTQNSDIQVVLARNNGTAVQGSGGIGASATNAFHVFDTTSVVKLLEVAQTSGNTTAKGRVQGTYFQGTSGQLLTKYVSSWNSGVQSHDIVYNGWNSTVSDYTYLKSAGNSTGGHGIIVAGDNGTYMGTTDIETGAITDSATAPLTNTWAYFRDTTAYIKGDTSFAGDVVVAGTLTAQEFHTEFVSASIIYESGSTKFGDTSDDSHDFTGSVNIDGTLSATVKSFDIEHPTQVGKRLVYGVLEGPEHAVYVRGESKEDTVVLPEEWKGLVDQDTITVQLTSIGSPDTYYYKTYENNSIIVGGPQKKHYFYYVQATRKDVEPLITVQ